MEFRKIFEDEINEAYSQQDLEKKARKALNTMDENIDILLAIMKLTGETPSGKIYKKFNKQTGEAWETASEYIDKEFGKDY